MQMENAIFEICHLQKLTTCWFVWHEIWPHLQGREIKNICKATKVYMVMTAEYERTKDCGVICPVSGRGLSSPWLSLSSSSLTSSPSPSTSPSSWATYCDAIRQKAVEVRLRDDEAVFACGRVSVTGLEMLNCWWYLFLGRVCPANWCVVQWCDVGCWRYKLSPRLWCYIDYHCVTQLKLYTST